MKEHLIHYFPFLNKEFRKLSDDELQSEEVFKELFPNEPIELHKLKAIALFQREEFKDIAVSFKEYVKNSNDKIELQIEEAKLKVKPNAKV